MPKAVNPKILWSVKAEEVDALGRLLWFDKLGRVFLAEMRNRKDRYVK